MIVTDREMNNTVLVVTVKVAVVLPAATVTLEGTVAYEVLLLLSVTVAPPLGARPLNVTVPVEFVPPLTLVGLRVKEESAGGVTVRVAEARPPPATIFAVVLEETGLVVTVNVDDVEPPGTVTLAGTCATLVWLELRLTTRPPAGAAALSLTVPVELTPPTTEVGLRVTDEACTGFTVRVVEALLL